ncbi:HAD family hydrolase, partial [Streptococcus pyogenes]
MAAEKGIYFVVASGRAVQSLKSLFAEFKDQVIFLGENGSEVEYRGKTLYEELMPKKLYLEILEKIKKSHFKNA